MQADLQGKVAVVTGGAVRVGKAITLALAEAGCNIFVHYGRSSAPAAQTRAEAERCGVEVETYGADLSDASAVLGVIPAVLNRFGRVDILVNNAAVFPNEGLTDTDIDSWEQQFAINLRAPFFLCQAFEKALGDEAQGGIVNVLDARIFRPAGDHIAYRLTKSGLLTMTESLAQALAPRIRVNAVALGAILPPPGEDEAALDRLASARVPLRRSGSVDFVAANVLHLLTQPFLTGVTIRLDGGEFL